MLIPIRTMRNIGLDTRQRLADALRGLAAALSNLLGLQSPHEASREDSSDDIAWAFSDIAETLRHLERAFDETPCYRMLAISVRKATAAVDELEEAWTQATAHPRLVAYGLDVQTKSDDDATKVLRLHTSPRAVGVRHRDTLKVDVPDSSRPLSDSSRNGRLKPYPDYGP